MIRCHHFYLKRTIYVDVLNNLSLPGNLLHIYYLCCLNSVLFISRDDPSKPCRAAETNIASESLFLEERVETSPIEVSLDLLLHQDDFYQILVKMKKRPESIIGCWRFQHMLTVWLFNTYMDDELSLLAEENLDGNVDPFVYIQSFYDDESRSRI